MKTSRSALAALALALVLAAPAGAKTAKAPTLAPQPVTALSATAASSLRILGDSTLHKWTVNAGQLEISAAAPGKAWDAAQKGRLQALKLSVAVEGLKSTENGTMDQNLYKAMGSAKFPVITFEMKAYEIKDGEVSAQGSLSIHGVSKDVELQGKISGEGPRLSVQGSYDLLMSDYGVKPPVMMLGTVRVADKVSIAYDFALEPKP